MDKLFRFLQITLFSLVALLLLGTAAVLFARRTADNSGATVPAAAAHEGDGYFTGIGRLRITLAGKGNAPMLVVTPVLPYDAADKSFKAELAANTEQLRRIITDYFSGLEYGEGALADEAELKRNIMEEINKTLRLGKITALYFEEFVLLE